MRLVRNAGTDRVADHVRSGSGDGARLDAVSPSFSLFGFAELDASLKQLARTRMVLPAARVKLDVLGDERGGGVLFTCLDPKVSVKDAEPLALGIAEWRTALAPSTETTCVFRDGVFANDVAKTNLAEILKQHGVAKVRSL